MPERIIALNTRLKKVIECHAIGQTKAPNTLLKLACAAFVKIIFVLEKNSKFFAARNAE